MIFRFVSHIPECPHQIFYLSFMLACWPNSVTLLSSILSHSCPVFCHSSVQYSDTLLSKILIFFVQNSTASSPNILLSFSITDLPVWLSSSPVFCHLMYLLYCSPLYKILVSSRPGLYPLLSHISAVILAKLLPSS